MEVFKSLLILGCGMILCRVYKFWAKLWSTIQNIVVFLIGVGFQWSMRQDIRTSKLFEYALKSYVRDLACCGMSWNNVQHKVQCDIEDTKTLSPSSHCFLTQCTSLCWPGLFSMVGFFWGRAFQEVLHMFVNGMMALHFLFNFTPLFSK